MRDCITTPADCSPLPPNKRVNYTFGMVLGEQDFRQEQEHFEWKHRISNLLLHGYGTVCGLQVTARPLEDGSDTEIYVTSGYAISPRGNWIWVDHDQCARIGAWLQRHSGDLPGFSGPGSYTAYVSLCYDECLVDLVPVAGRACASDEDTRAPSRRAGNLPHRVLMDRARPDGRGSDACLRRSPATHRDHPGIWLAARPRRQRLPDRSGAQPGTR